MMKYHSTIGLAIALFAIQGGAGTALGDTDPAAVVSAAKTGMVTDVSAHDIEIDGYRYKIKTGVEMVDREGEPLMESEGVPFPVTKIVLGSAVTFYLKTGEIQKMIVTFPQ